MRYLFLSIFFLAGCVTTQSLPVGDRSRTYDLEYDFVFDMTVQVLAEQGYAVVDAEKDNGIINTDYRLQDDLLSFFTSPARMKISALISNAPDGTRVLVNFDIQDAHEDAAGVYNSRSLTTRQARKYYTEFFSSLEEYLQ